MDQEISKVDKAEKLLDKIKSNQPEKDLAQHPDKDFLEIIPKGNMIKAFLESLLKREETDIQMIALYGEWGSGKTSLMRYVQSKLDEENENFTTVFSTVFFEAWKLENDNDLALSLMDSILNQHQTAKVMRKELFDAFLAVTKGIVNGLSINTPLIKFDFSKLYAEIGNHLDDKSLEDKIISFQNQYKKLEQNILREKKALVVFIDDLDRCEPENVLKLLSAIKLFFTFGNKTIFVCGIDKDAVDKAVKCQYGDVVKSGEYLEKIFDISFDMPQPNINKMIDYYFKDLPENDDDIKKVKEFFEAMHFVNPRKLKKVLNKYLMIRYYQESDIDDKGLIPDQKIDFFRYLTLFIIMLYKFEPENFKILRDYDEKLNYWKYNSENKNVNILSLQNLNHLKEGTINNIYEATLSIIRDTKNPHIKASLQPDDGILTTKMIALFAPRIKNHVDFYGNDDYCKQFMKQEKISYAAYFCNYINLNINQGLLIDNRVLLKAIQNNSYRLWDIFEMAELYL
jgi:predicted KAP-like P-loop ATPase